MRLTKLFSCALFLVAVTLSASAEVITMEEIDAALRRSPRMCPAQPAIVTLMSYKDHCGKDYDKTMGTLEALRCQNETDALNKKIAEYNSFMRECLRPRSTRRGGGFLMPSAPEERSTPARTASTTRGGGFLTPSYIEPPEKKPAAPARSKPAERRQATATWEGDTANYSAAGQRLRACLDHVNHRFCEACDGTWACTRACVGERKACEARFSGADEATVQRIVAQSDREVDEAFRPASPGYAAPPAVDPADAINIIGGIIGAGGAGGGGGGGGGGYVPRGGNGATNPKFPGGMRR
jgi:hypothetical protein